MLLCLLGRGGGGGGVSEANCGGGVLGENFGGGGGSISGANCGDGILGESCGGDILGATKSGESYVVWGKILQAMLKSYVDDGNEDANLRSLVATSINSVSKQKSVLLELNVCFS